MLENRLVENNVFVQFNSSSDVVTHSRVHTGGKPYNSIDCDKQFTIYNLKKKTPEYILGKNLITAWIMICNLLRVVILIVLLKYIH